MRHHRSVLPLLATAAAAVLLVGCHASGDSTDAQDSGSDAASASSTGGGSDSAGSGGGSKNGDAAAAQNPQGGQDSASGSQDGGAAPQDEAHDNHLHGSGSLCDVGPLDFKMTGYGSAAGAGSVYVVLTNAGMHPCHTQGFLGLQLDKGNDQVPAHMDRGLPGNPDDPAKAIELASGDSAWAELQWNSGSDTCGMENIDPELLEITPPDSRQHKTLSWDYGRICGDGGIDMSPLHAGQPPTG